MYNIYIYIYIYIYKSYSHGSFPLFICTHFCNTNSPFSLISYFLISLILHLIVNQVFNRRVIIPDKSKRKCLQNLIKIGFTINHMASVLAFWLPMYNLDKYAIRRTRVVTYKKLERGKEGTTCWPSLVKLGCHLLEEWINLKIQVKSFHIYVLDIRLYYHFLSLLKEYFALNYEVLPKFSKHKLPSLWRLTISRHHRSSYFLPDTFRYITITGKSTTKRKTSIIPDLLGEIVARSATLCCQQSQDFYLFYFEKNI